MARYVETMDSVRTLAVLDIASVMEQLVIIVKFARMVILQQTQGSVHYPNVWLII